MPLTYEYPLTRDDLPVFPGLASGGWNVFETKTIMPHRPGHFQVFLKPAGQPVIHNLPDENVQLPVLLLQAVPVKDQTQEALAAVKADIHEVMDIIFTNCKSPVRVDRIEVMESPRVEKATG